MFVLKKAPLPETEKTAYVGLPQPYPRSVLRSGYQRPQLRLAFGSGAGGSNHLRLDCISSEVTLYVDGRQVVTAQIECAPSQGLVGLAPGRAPEGQTEFRFDNFAIYQP